MILPVILWGTGLTVLRAIAGRLTCNKALRALIDVTLCFGFLFILWLILPPLISGIGSQASMRFPLNSLL